MVNRLNFYGCGACNPTPNQGSAFGSGGPEPDRAEPGFRAAGTGLGLDVNGLAGLGLKVCGLTLTKISGSARNQPDFLDIGFSIFLYSDIQF